MIHNSPKFIFWGVDAFSVIILDELKKAGFTPALVVTSPDKKRGRGMLLSPPPAKLWAQKNNISFLQPEDLKNLKSEILNLKSDLFIVASYGKILSKELLAIPKRGTLNVHPSLLPLYRGPTPIQSQILDGAENVGVTIMLIDEKIDHGPILAQQVLGYKIYDLRFKDLRDALAHLGGKLLAETIPGWIAGNIEPQEQEHTMATNTKKIAKEDGLVDVEKEDPETLYRKFLAYTPWPGLYFFKEIYAEQRGTRAEKRRKIRIKITDAELRSDLKEERSDGERSDLAFIIKKIIPESGREMKYGNFVGLN